MSEVEAATLATANETTFADHESTIRDGLRTFVEVGQALAAIRDGRLYKEAGFKNFEAYCRDRWDFGKAYANRLVQASTVAIKVAPIGAEVTTESQARELAKVPEERQPDAWKEAVETAPEGKVTAKHVAEVASRYCEPEPGPDDGQGNAVFRGETSVDEETGETFCDGCGSTQCVCEPAEPQQDDGKRKRVVRCLEGAAHAIETARRALDADDPDSAKALEDANAIVRERLRAVTEGVCA